MSSWSKRARMSKSIKTSPPASESKCKHAESRGASVRARETGEWVTHAPDRDGQVGARVDPHPHPPTHTHPPLLPRWWRVKMACGRQAAKCDKVNLSVVLGKVARILGLNACVRVYCMLTRKGLLIHWLIFEGKLGSSGNIYGCAMGIMIICVIENKDEKMAWFGPSYLEWLWFWMLFEQKRFRWRRAYTSDHGMHSRWTHGGKRNWALKESTGEENSYTVNTNGVTGKVTGEKLFPIL